jgi:ubiquinone/menaquinone biosynthesis C-methylase UbiE
MLEASIPKGRVSDLYRKIAPTYDLWAGLTETKARDRCLELAAIQDGEAVLEVAVGTGLAFERILKSNPSGRNEGIDLTEAMLRRAERRAAKSGVGNYRLRIGDAYALDFPDADFDILINNYMFDLLPQQDFLAVLTEFKRVLRPGGRLAMVNMTRGKYWYNKIWEGIYRMNPAWLGGCRGVQLFSELEACGFIRIKREYVEQFSFPSEVVYAEAP